MRRKEDNMISLPWYLSFPKGILSKFDHAIQLYVTQLSDSFNVMLMFSIHDSFLTRYDAFLGTEINAKADCQIHEEGLNAWEDCRG